MTSACPRCTTPRDQRDGSYFVCPDCRWRWTVSITGKVYLQDTWTPASGPHHADGEEHARMEHLLGSVEGLTQKLAQPWPPRPEPADAALEPADFPARVRDRLRAARAAVEAGYFNEGVPLARLRAEGVPSPPPPTEPDRDESA